MKVALLCSGLGNINRGHEIFARDLFDLLKNDIDITLYKGGGKSNKREILVNHINRYSKLLDNIKVNSSKKWEDSIKEETKIKIELKTFSYSVLKELLKKDYNIIHCTDKDVCNIIYENRLLFKKIPKIVYSNGGALIKKKLPSCDLVLEYTKHNLKRSDKSKAFLIPHGVDLKKFNPNLKSDFRKKHKIPEDSLLVLSVGTICFWHKRMDYLIKEVSKIKNAYLVIVGQESVDSQKIKILGNKLMKERIKFLTLPHEELPNVYKASDVFVLASLFETFGIVYIEAMAMGLPVISTNHENQKSIIQKGIFINMNKRGNLTRAILSLDKEKRQNLGVKGRKIVEEQYDYNLLKQKYIEVYKKIIKKKTNFKKYTFKDKILYNIKNVFLKALR